MGEGEEYWKKFDQWYRRLQPAHRERYAAEHPEPDGWDGFYARKDSYLPLWKVMQDKRNGSRATLPIRRNGSPEKVAQTGREQAH